MFGALAIEEDNWEIFAEFELKIVIQLVNLFELSMDEYLEVIKQAFYFLFRAYLVYIIYLLAKSSVLESTVKPLRLYIITILTALFLSWLSSAWLGTHVENADPMFGGGDRITDFNVSDSKRIKYGLGVFIIVVTPAIVGVWNGLKGRKLNQKRDSNKNSSVTNM